MERERHAVGAQKIFSGIFALVIAGMIIVLVIFVVRRVGEMQDVCAMGQISGAGIEAVCGDGGE